MKNTLNKPYLVYVTKIVGIDNFLLTLMGFSDRKCINKTAMNDY